MPGPGLPRGLQPPAVTKEANLSYTSEIWLKLSDALPQRPKIARILLPLARLPAFADAKAYPLESHTERLRVSPHGR
jgi:hypothetical protein